jgi:hypothetical protein
MVLLAQHRKVEWTWLNETLDQVADACAAMDSQKLAELLEQLVPEHRDMVERSLESSH